MNVYKVLLQAPRFNKTPNNIFICNFHWGILDTKNAYDKFAICDCNNLYMSQQESFKIETELYMNYIEIVNRLEK